MLKKNEKKPSLTVPVPDPVSPVRSSKTLEIHLNGWQILGWRLGLDKKKGVKGANNSEEVEEEEEALNEDGMSPRNYSILDGRAKRTKSKLLVNKINKKTHYFCLFVCFSLFLPSGNRCVAWNGEGFKTRNPGKPRGMYRLVSEGILSEPTHD